MRQGSSNIRSLEPTAANLAVTLQFALKALVTSPVGQGPLAGAQHCVDGDNPICGDKLRFMALTDSQGVTQLGFVATACPATIAVASCVVALYSEQPVGDSARPEGPPYAELRQRVESLGGLSNFEGHALALVEDVLSRLLQEL